VNHSANFLSGPVRGGGGSSSSSSSATVNHIKGRESLRVSRNHLGTVEETRYIGFSS